MTELLLAITCGLLGCNALVVALWMRRTNKTIEHMLLAARAQNQMLLLLFMRR